MPILLQGQSATVQLTEGETVTVTPSGQAQVSTRGVSGSALSEPTTITTATTFGPYSEGGTLSVGAIRGSVDYTVPEFATAVRSLVAGAGIVNSRDAMQRVTSYSVGGTAYTVTYDAFGVATISGGGQVMTVARDASGLVTAVSTI